MKAPTQANLILVLCFILLLILLGLIVGGKAFTSWLIMISIIIGWSSRKIRGWTPSFTFLFEDDIADGE